MQNTWVQFLSQKGPLEKGMATHFSVLAWIIPWTEEPGSLQFMSRKESDYHHLLTRVYSSVVVCLGPPLFWAVSIEHLPCAWGSVLKLIKSLSHEDHVHLHSQHISVIISPLETPRPWICRRKPIPDLESITLFLDHFRAQTTNSETQHCFYHSLTVLSP